MVHKVQYLFLPLGSVIALVWLLSSSGIIPFPFAMGQEAPPADPEPAPQAAALIEETIFRTSDQSSVLVRPLFDDLSTNIAFYMKCPNIACPSEGTLEAPVYIFSAENLGRGILPFSEYWAPPLPTDYVAIEYRNDDQQYTCSDKTITECQNDPRFISLFEFAIVSDDTTITLAMLAEKNRSGTSTPVSLALDNLEQLSIALSAPSITSDLTNGQIVSAILDGKSLEDTTNATSSLAKLSIALSAPAISSDLDNGQTVTAILDGKLLADTANTTSALTELSITLSATSITSDLSDGQTVTAVLDGQPNTATGSPMSDSEEEDDSISIGEFILGVIDTVIDVFVPGDQATDPSPATEEDTSTPDESVPPEVVEVEKTEQVEEAENVEQVVEEAPAPEETNQNETPTIEF
jgi:hypothetical protein